MDDESDEARTYYAPIDRQHDASSARLFVWRRRKHRGNRRWGGHTAAGSGGSGGTSSVGPDASTGSAGSNVVAGDAGGESAVEAGPPAPPGGPDEPIPADPGPQPFLHSLFTDHVVLQRDALTPVWGWSTAGDKITVKIANQTYTATADQYGRWLVRIGPFKADTASQTLEVSGPQTITIQDVQFGDVWLCSGQSNMSSTSPAVSMPPPKSPAARIRICGSSS